MHNVLFESAAFNLFLTCLANAREHGFDVGADDFCVVAETQIARRASG